MPGGRKRWAPRNRSGNPNPIHYYGEQHPQAKLNKEKVLFILQNRQMSLKALAEKFGVSTGAIQGVRDGKTWQTVYIDFHSNPDNDPKPGEYIDTSRIIRKDEDDADISFEDDYRVRSRAATRKLSVFRVEHPSRQYTGYVFQFKKTGEFVFNRPITLARAFAFLDEYCYVPYDEYPRCPEWHWGELDDLLQAP